MQEITDVSNESSPISPTVLPWDRFSNWIHCISVVTFDLELGQSLELIYPPHIKLTDKEKSNICYLSFPDSNSGCMGDTQFHFRIRQCGDVKRGISTDHINYNKGCPIAQKVDNGYFYGYVYFRQVKDKSLRRGYFQKSVVLISKLPFHRLYYYLLQSLAPEYFDNDEPSIEAASHDIDQWSAPVPGMTVNLPIMGTVVQVRIPSCLDQNSSTSPAGGNYSNLMNTDLTMQTSLPAPHILPSVFEMELYKSLLPVLQHIQLLWELVFTNEPLAVIASSPSQSSEMVQTLVSMMLPLRYCSDYRPFFTIHDTEFREYTTKTQAPPRIILGVTNPFFAKTLQHWPHIIRIGDDAGPGMTSQHSSPALNKFTSSNKLKKGGNLKTLDSKPGLYTTYKPYLNRDRTIIKALSKGALGQRPMEAQSAILKRYFLELTQSFMIPLERYVASLMPLKKDVSPFRALPPLRPFNTEEFVISLEQAGPQLTSGLKGDWQGLYLKYFKSPNFSGWFRARLKEMNNKLQIVQLQTLAEQDINQWSVDKSEVEIVDMVLKIKEKILCCKQNQLAVELCVYHTLTSQINTLIGLLPDDLKHVLHTSVTIAKARNISTTHA